LDENRVTVLAISNVLVSEFYDSIKYIFLISLDQRDVLVNKKLRLLN
jgi:hypothetical protein